MNMSLEDYVRPITAKSFEWTTILNLTDITCSRSELVSIHRLTNIGALTIGPGVQMPDVGIDDSILRSWTRAATENNAFSMLKVIACRGQRQLTARAFDYISRLKALSLFALEKNSLGSYDKHIAKALGWKYTTGKALSTILDESFCTNDSWESVIKALHTYGRGLCAVSTAQTEIEDDSCLQYLSLSLGGKQKSATVDIVGKDALCCFERVRVLETGCSENETTARHSERHQWKRPSTEDHSGELNKKRTVKASKFVENAFIDFGI